jgi:hypothetical protein
MATVHMVFTFTERAKAELRKHGMQEKFSVKMPDNAPLMAPRGRYERSCRA